MMEDWENFAWVSRRPALQDISTGSLTRGSPADPNMVFIHEPYATPSPEEQIIRARRPKILLQSAMLLQNDSADFLQATPSSALSGLSRKRLHMTPPNSPCSSPYKVSPVKRPRLQRKPQVPLSSELQAYSTQQLIDVIDRLVIQHPEIEDDVRGSLGSPDLKPMQAELDSLRKNVYRSIPSRQWGSSRDSFCYKHARVHIKAFKKALIEQGKRIVMSQSWETLINYVLGTWKLVHKLPIWEDSSHNTPRTYCFRHLAAQCMIALRKGSFEKEQLVQLKDKIEKAAALSAEMKPCITETQKLFENMSL